MIFLEDEFLISEEIWVFSIEAIVSLCFFDPKFTFK